MKEPGPRSQVPELPAAPARLLDLVGYQDGAIVSRALLKRETGSITLFAFDQGQGLSEHSAPFDVLAHILEGEAEIAISGKSLPVEAGEAMLLPAHQPHALKATRKLKMLLVMLRP